MRTTVLLGLLVSLSLPCLAGETATKKGLFEYKLPAGYYHAPKEEQLGELAYLAVEVNGYRSNVLINTWQVDKKYTLQAIGDAIVQQWKASGDKSMSNVTARFAKLNGNELYLIACMYRLETKQLTGQYHVFFKKGDRLVSITFSALAKDVALGKKFLKSLETFRWLR